MRELICDQFNLLRHAPLRTFPCVAFGFLLLKKYTILLIQTANMYQEKSIYISFGGMGEVEGRDENIRAPLVGRCFFRLSIAIYNFLILPTYQIERICLCT